MENKKKFVPSLGDDVGSGLIKFGIRDKNPRILGRCLRFILNRLNPNVKEQIPMLSNFNEHNNVQIGSASGTRSVNIFQKYGSKDPDP
jgi:hypothetical protein